MTAASIITHGNKLFTERMPLLTHFQELGELFYYERASFTGPVGIGDDFASGSMTSSPAIARREMGNLFRAMLRPQDFFKISVEGVPDEGPERSYLERTTELMRTTMYRKGGGFVRASVTTDHDYVTFGQGVIEVCMMPDRDGTYHKNHHLKDVVWSTDYAGNIESIHRDCHPTASTLVKLFPKGLPEEIGRIAEKEPYRKLKARHVVAPVGIYDIEAKGTHEFISTWVLPEHDKVIESVTRPFKGYVIPRADLPDGSQYARSPFTSIILPDARTKQSIERILLEAGEKAVDPPMVAVKEALRGDIGLYAGGITYLDMEYDERLGAALRPIPQDKSGLPIGLEMSAQYDRIIQEGMMLNKINLPDISGRTAYEVRKLTEQHMRAHVPMFEPVEAEYNEPLVEENYEVMKYMGAFPVADMPESLRDVEAEWEFKSPIKDMEAESKPQQMMEGLQILDAGSKIEPGVIQMVNGEEITKDALRAVGWPEEWFKDAESFAAAKAAMQEQMEGQQAMEETQQVAETAGKVGLDAEFLKGLVGDAA